MYMEPQPVNVAEQVLRIHCQKRIDLNADVTPRTPLLSIKVHGKYLHVPNIEAWVPPLVLLGT